MCDFLLTAAFGIITTVICSKCRPRERLSGWKKIGKNVERDERDIQRLQALGWRVLIVWECALRGRAKLSDAALAERLEEWICGGGASAQIDTQGIHLLA
ncbi:patch repair protein [Salmonella sp. NCTC 11881]|nr:patch repair protein [Salmonella sp. NCTC 11881]